MNPEPVTMIFRIIVPVHVLEKCLSKMAECRGSWCLTSCRAFSQCVYNHSSSSPICTEEHFASTYTYLCPIHSIALVSRCLPVHPSHCTELKGGVHTCIPKGILATYSHLSQYVEEQKDGIWFMRFPLALPHSLNLLHVICEGSDPQDQMDVVFTLFSFEVKLWKTVPQYRINSKAFPF